MATKPKNNKPEEIATLTHEEAKRKNIPTVGRKRARSPVMEKEGQVSRLTTRR
jgi:hypothetical protein